MDMFSTGRSGNIESCRAPCGFTSEKESLSLSDKTKLNCPYCCIAFCSTTKMAKHLATEHLDYAPYRCPFPQCQQSRYSRGKLSEHIFAKRHGPPSNFHYEEDEEKRTKLDNIIKDLMYSVTFNAISQSNKRSQSRIDEREQVDVTTAHQSVGSFAQVCDDSWTDTDTLNRTAPLVKPVIEEADDSFLVPVKFDTNNLTRSEGPKRKRKREWAGSRASDEDIMEDEAANENRDLLQQSAFTTTKNSQQPNLLVLDCDRRLPVEIRFVGDVYVSDKMIVGAKRGVPTISPTDGTIHDHHQAILRFVNSFMRTVMADSRAIVMEKSPDSTRLDDVFLMAANQPQPLQEALLQYLKAFNVPRFPPLTVTRALSLAIANARNRQYNATRKLKRRLEERTRNRSDDGCLILKGTFLESAEQPLLELE